MAVQPKAVLPSIFLESQRFFSAMSVPDFQSLMLPVLRLANGSDVRTSEAVERIATEFHLSPDERAELLPSGRQTKIANRVYWAFVYLSKAGLLNRRQRGLYGVTDQGRKVLAKPPARIDIPFLSQFKRFNEFRAKSPETNDAEHSPKPISMLAVGTPDERIETALNELNVALRAELLERVLSMTPTAFEKLIVDLMLGMGYGAKGSGEHLGRTSDGGVDGVINEDVLGLDIIYLQAKRYAVGNGIGVEKIREFAGVLDERGATKGVFVTTSHFATQARTYGKHSPKRLILIDGEELARLLVQYGIGVRVYRAVEMKKLDLDYFEEL
ncbi:MAG TPA: restriction endonuclease, partial [Roseiarcus sp.]|nr:restriction endonuclease [Roseiarcus sp.]